MQNSYLVVGSRSSTLPVPLAELKEHLPVFGSQDDNRLTALEWAAVDFLERQTNRYLVTTSVTEIWSRFPAIWDRSQGYPGTYGSWIPYPFLNSPTGLPYDWGRWQRMELSRSPVQSITSLQYWDALNVSRTLTLGTDFYLLNPTDRPAFIQPVMAWPIAYFRPEAISLTYSAGYTTLPGCLNAAIKLLVGHWNEHREAQAERNVTDISFGLEALIQSVSTGGYY